MGTRNVAARNMAELGLVYCRELVRQRWNFLSERDLDEIGGDREKLVAKIEERYGLCTRRADRWVQDFLETIV